MANRISIETRFWSKVQKGAPNDCWEWQACKRAGYGLFHVGPVRKGAKMAGAHRIAYELANGPLDPSLDVMHTCDNPGCVNPRHLKAGTHAENMQDMDCKGRRTIRRGSKHHKAILSEQQVLDIREQLAAGRRGRHIAAEYSVTESVISAIKKGRAWRHI